MTLSYSHCASCMWVIHLKVTQSFDKGRVWESDKPGQNCGFHVASVECPLKSWDYHLIGVCRWFFFLWNCTPAWQPSHNWGLGFSNLCSEGWRFWRHSDWTESSTYGCLYLTSTSPPPNLSLNFLQVPLVGMIPISCSRVMVVIIMIIF